MNLAVQSDVHATLFVADVGVVFAALVRGHNILPIDFVVFEFDAWQFVVGWCILQAI